MDKLTYTIEELVTVLDSVTCSSNLDDDNRSLVYNAVQASYRDAWRREIESLHGEQSPHIYERLNNCQLYDWLLDVRFLRLKMKIDNPVDASPLLEYYTHEV